MGELTITLNDADILLIDLLQTRSDSTGDKNALEYVLKGKVRAKLGNLSRTLPFKSEGRLNLQSTKMKKRPSSIKAPSSSHPLPA